ncbi:MAG: DUF3830 family protein [Trueperaceae bacterium]
MPQKRRRIRLTFVATGESVIAELLDDEAPATCELVWNMLPLEHDLYHGRFSGSEVFVLLDDAPEVPPEQRCHMPLPGEILYWRDEGTAVTSGGRPVAEIVMAFGRAVRLGGPEGMPSYGNLFARVPGDWKYDWTEFAEACRRVRTGGLTPLRVERLEDGE